jgi:hypothetical protein
VVAGLGAIVQGDPAGLVQVDAKHFPAPGPEKLDVDQFQASGLGHFGGTGEKTLFPSQDKPL